MHRQIYALLLLSRRVRHYGGLAPGCASTFYRYGGALLCKAREAANRSGNVSKRAPNEESITPTTNKDDSEEGMLYHLYHFHHYRLKYITVFCIVLQVYGMVS